jgi:tRNA pseudouridine65 synthase
MVSASIGPSARARGNALTILHRDERICAVAKPSGLMMHRTGISSDRVFLADLLREQLGQRIWTVHRLDRATSGVVICALDREAAAELGRQFQSGTVDKHYLAVVRGWPEVSGRVEKPLSASRGRLQDATTRYRCLARTELPVPVPPHATARYTRFDAISITSRTRSSATSIMATVVTTVCSGRGSDATVSCFTPL